MRKREVNTMRSGRSKLKLLRSITTAGVEVSNHQHTHHASPTTINSSSHLPLAPQSQHQPFIRQHFTSARPTSQKTSSPNKNSSPPLGNNNHNHNNNLINNSNNHNRRKSFHSVSALVHPDHNINLIDAVGPFEGFGGNLIKMEPGPTNSDIRLKAFGICRDYLHGAWKQIDLRDLVLKRVNGGLSNWLYHCSLPLNMAPLSGEPTEVLLRFYGQVHGEDALESLITESVVFTLLSERKLGPRLYGVFPGGRIEQFIPARPLMTKELRDPDISKLITSKMAQIHALNIPISKEPIWLWGTIDRWMSNIRENLSKSSLIDSRQEEITRTLIDHNLEDEVLWLKRYLPLVGSPVVFSHNDLQEGNILIRPDHKILEEKLVLIDFEYCSYNYRGFDLANHFCEWSFNYNVQEYPNFIHNVTDLPTIEEKRDFIRNYLTVLKREYKLNHAGMDEDFFKKSVLFNEDHVLKEIEAFTLASHFFWCLWAIVNAQISKIPFGYWEYGISRLEAYFTLKEKHLN